MTEFLKNNPIALRHCLLYEFLQGKPFDRAFSYFCYTLGEDIIKKESFEFWFDKFKRGLLDDIIEPITDMRDVLRDDKYALLACILYEVLNSSSSAYKNFCGVIGDDAIEYREFDFWFYRFLNGEFDLNFERDKDKKIYELMNMPLDIMKNIVECTDIFDRISLARASQSLKTFVEDQKLFHHQLELNVYNNFANLEFGPEGRNILYGKSEKSIEGVPFWKQAIHDFKAVLKYPKLHVNTLNIEFHTHSPTLIEKMIDELVPMHQLHLQNFYISAYSTDPLLKILPLFTPGYLTAINLHVQEIDDSVMNKVAELEQWKQAKYFSMGSCPIVPLRYFYHFKEIHVCWVNLSAEDIREIKRVLFTSPVLKKCNFALGYHTEKSIIKEEFGEPIPEERHTYHYPITNSNEYFEIYVRSWTFEVTRKLK